MQSAFYDLADGVFSKLAKEERATLWLSAERSDFVRLNRGKVRQPGSVEQRRLTLRLLRGRRHAGATVGLSGRREEDLALLVGELGRLRELLALLPEDPHLLYNEAPTSSEEHKESRLPEATEAVEHIVAAAAGYDLVGIYAAGALYRGFASSLGQRNWFRSDTFNFDFSLYAGSPSKSAGSKDKAFRDKAAKAAYAGRAFDPAALRAKVEEAAGQLSILTRPPKTIAPSTYRAYLAPAAVAELMNLLGWDSFSTKLQRAKQSALIKMVEEGARLSEAFTLVEDLEGGVGPSFLPSGFVRPARVPLIAAGRLVGSLTSARTFKEYSDQIEGLTINAGEEEQPTALDLAAGELPKADALSALDTGLYITNLWYTNYSDPLTARITGMTRFATMWVEEGEVVAPLNVMRFDDSLYRLFGSELLGLTRERELLISSGTYEERSTGSMRLPGALIGAMSFPL